MKLLKALLVALLLLSVSAMHVVAGDDANPGDIVINEIMKDPSHTLDTNGEWFEVYNTSSSSINIGGWTIQSASTGEPSTHTIAGILDVSPGSYVVLCRNGTSSVNGGVPCDYAYGNAISLNNDGADDLILQEDAGTQQLIASITFNDTSWPDPEGASMVYIPSAKPPISGYFIDNNDPNQWGISTSSYSSYNLGTPGARNDQGDISTAIVITRFVGSTRSFTGLAGLVTLIGVCLTVWKRRSLLIPS